MPCYFVRFTNARTRRAGAGDIHGDEQTGRNYEAGHMLFPSEQDIVLYARHCMPHCDLYFERCTSELCEANKAVQRNPLLDEPWGHWTVQQLLDIQHGPAYHEWRKSCPEL